MKETIQNKHARHKREAIAELDKMEQQVEKRNWNNAKTHHERADKLMQKI